MVCYTLVVLWSDCHIFWYTPYAVPHRSSPEADCHRCIDCLPELMSLLWFTYCGPFPKPTVTNSLIISQSDCHIPYAVTHGSCYHTDCHTTFIDCFPEWLSHIVSHALFCHTRIMSPSCQSHTHYLSFSNCHILRHTPYAVTHRSCNQADCHTCIDCLSEWLSHIVIHTMCGHKQVQ